MSPVPLSLWRLAGSALPGNLQLFLYALLFALVEIEIEGKDGWAMNLPTWYRRKPLYARVFAKLLSGKPLTGYHAIMFFIPFLSFHLGFAFGQAWSWELEARLVATYLVWNVTWDFLWFVLNPHFGWARFRKGQIWWHDGAWLGRMPIDYVNALWLSCLVAALPWLARGNARALFLHAVFLACMAMAVAITKAMAPLYRRWYHHMRRPGSDER